MSSPAVRLAAPRQAPHRDQRESRRPSLRIVRAQEAARSRAPFVLLCAGILLGALLVALALNTSMAATAYAMRDKQQELTTLTQEEQRLATAVEAASAPAAVVERAEELGLEPSPGVTYLRLSDRSILGGQE